MDKRKKIICVLDTETLGVDKPLVYDLGISIVDKQGNIYAQRNWIIKEVFEQKEKMQSAYYACKLPKYDKMIAEGKAILMPWEEVRREFNKVLEQYNVKVISAYNLGFDIRAMNYTNKCLGQVQKFLIPRVKYETWDLWGMATQTILRQKTYHRIAERENWKSPKGNILTNAEVTYRYITNQMDFIEDHTALSDTEIETKIMVKCLKQHKKMEKKILGMPWRLAQTVA